MKYTIICDGSCLKNPGPGGWAYAVIDANRNLKYYSGHEKHTTNNIMELTAMIEAIKHGEVKVIYSDSTYVVTGIKAWLKKWKVSGWKNSKKEVVKNLELWQTIDKIYDPKVEVKWIKGHASPEDYSCEQDKFLIEVQNKVDELAREAAGGG